MKPFPLNEANRSLLAEAFADGQRVDLAIDCAIEGTMGTVLVDQPEAPTGFLLRAGIFHYFAGNPDSAASRGLIAAIEPPALLMPSGPGWLEVAYTLHRERPYFHTRYSFSADSLAADHLHRLASRSSTTGHVAPIDATTIGLVGEPERDLLAIDAFDSTADFLQRGRGYFWLAGGQPVGAAHASLVCSKGIEVSIFVQSRQRRRGIATALAARLLLDCLDEGLEPHWDAANSESIGLAKKLGYQPLGPYEAAYLGT
ncbi:MAG: GNAT family N-acetyltransferase [Candidatus Promineifilaceae bacterium]|nr:GNAT family N-acetyltransferase [Candidatus Promineifilaceae bacterium]